MKRLSLVLFGSVALPVLFSGAANGFHLRPRATTTGPAAVAVTLWRGGSSAPLTSAAIPPDDAADITEIVDDEDVALALLELEVKAAENIIVMNWGWILNSGILNILGGSLALILPLSGSSVAYSIVAATLGVVGGFGIAGSTIDTVEPGFRVKSFLFGALNLFLCYRMSKNPFGCLNVLTAYILTISIAEGLHETVFAVQNKKLPHRKWNILSGLSSIAVSVFAMIKMPVSSLVVPGICLGVNLISLGTSKVGIALLGQVEANRRMGFLGNE
ncbi:expressed unknown protein [Seminavis robusta]|uniref:Uncharacterized protein n=1 Tax=Seminavis robusta TaxID=568900 RepID=A0A9N8HHY8_9STRA|nr:expressed unknown protein [Seminavis robusta]|eukprot:Sro562_g167060.1 n/a (273) ;mRNA; f:35224-36042